MAETITHSQKLFRHTKGFRIRFPSRSNHTPRTGLNAFARASALLSVYCWYLALKIKSTHLGISITVLIGLDSLTPEGLDHGPVTGCPVTPNDAPSASICTVA